MSYSAFDWIDPINHNAIKTEQIHLNSVSGIPILTPFPQETLFAFRGLCQLSLSELESEATQLQGWIRSLSSDSMPRALDAIKDRLELKRNLIEKQIRFFSDLTRPLSEVDPKNRKMTAGQWLGFHFESSIAQTVFRYTPSLIRDWCASYESENRQMRDVLLQLTARANIDGSKCKKVAFLGCGGARLAYDFAVEFPEASVLGLDLSPVMLLAAQRVLNGETLHPVDFARAPFNMEKPGRPVELRMSTPQGQPGARLCLAFADVHHLPLADQSVDCIVTPWLIDIVNRPFADLAQEISRVLRPGGAWLNLGTLRPNFSDERLNHGFREIELIASEFGLKNRILEGPLQPQVQYLNSDLDAHQRTETLTGFAFEKSANVTHDVPPNRALWPKWFTAEEPDWSLDPTKPIPLTEVLQNDAVAQSVQAFTLSLVDGKRSLNEISQHVAKAFGLSESQAQSATVHFFRRYFALDLKRLV